MRGWRYFIQESGTCKYCNKYVNNLYSHQTKTKYCIKIQTELYHKRLEEYYSEPEIIFHEETNFKFSQLESHIIAYYFCDLPVLLNWIIDKFHLIEDRYIKMIHRTYEKYKSLKVNEKIAPYDFPIHMVYDNNWWKRLHDPSLINVIEVFKDEININEVMKNPGIFTENTEFIKFLNNEPNDYRGDSINMSLLLEKPKKIKRENRKF